jgi:flagellar secretion chaperone FliS
MLQDDGFVSPYLQQEVLSASQIRLRWLLISKAAELCSGVAQMWKAEQAIQGDQWALRVREILGELLAGVSSENPLSKTVSDFYLYLLQSLTKAEKSRDASILLSMRDLLAYDAETWQFLMQQHLATPVHAPSGAEVPKPLGIDCSDLLTTDGSFSLDV